jgi:hypothetical protein
MPVTDRLVHALAIVTPTDDVGDPTDEYGQPLPGIPTVLLSAGLIQPKSAREMALVSQAGPQLSDHVIFLPAGTAIESASYVRFEPDDGDRYEVTGIRSYAYGTVNDHLEVDCRRVRSEALMSS